MQLPAVLPLTFFLMLVPVVIPIIERFWPSANVWWAAILIAILGAAASAIQIVFRKPLSEAGLPQPSAQATPTPDGDDYAYNRPAPKQPSKMRSWLLG